MSLINLLEKQIAKMQSDICRLIEKNAELEEKIIYLRYCQGCGAYYHSSDKFQCELEINNTCQWIGKR